MKKHGTFSAMEIGLKKTILKKKQLEKHGGWYTKVYLSNVHWTKPFGLHVCSYIVMHYITKLTKPKSSKGT